MNFELSIDTKFIYLWPIYVAEAGGPNSLNLLVSAIGIKFHLIIA